MCCDERNDLLWRLKWAQACLTCKVLKRKYARSWRCNLWLFVFTRWDLHICKFWPTWGDVKSKRFSLSELHLLVWWMDWQEKRWKRRDWLCPLKSAQCVMVKKQSWNLFPLDKWRCWFSLSVNTALTPPLFFFLQVLDICSLNHLIYLNFKINPWIL